MVENKSKDVWTLPGQGDIKDMTGLEERGRRFKEVNNSPVEEDIHEAEKIIKRLDLPEFTKTTEERFEDYIDMIADKINRVKPSLVTLEVALGYSKMTLNRSVNEVVEAQTYDELFDNFARTYFPTSTYDIPLALEIVNAKRCATTADAYDWISTRMARYARVCKRNGECPQFTDKLVTNSFINSLPTAIQNYLKHHRMKDPRLSIRSIMQTAMEVEEALRIEGEPLTELPQFAAIDEEDGEVRERRPNRKCYACGEEGHFANKCNFRDYRCSHCNFIGHIANACRNHATRDADGRIRHVTQNRPGGIVSRNVNDRTYQQKTKTAIGTLNEIDAVIDKRTDTNRQSRKRRNVRMGKVVRPQKDHPVGVITQENDLEALTRKIIREIMKKQFEVEDESPSHSVVKYQEESSSEDDSY